MSLTLMTFNLRFDKPDPGEQAWVVRRDLAAQAIRQFMPDIIGTQEGLAHQLDDLQRLLPEYQRIGRDRIGTGRGEHCAILYRHGEWACEQHGDFSLSDTPEIPGSITWGHTSPRMCTWGVFSGKAKRLTLFNTHLDNKSDVARLNGIDLIRSRMCAMGDVPTFLTGDFNCEPADPPRQRMLEPLAGRRWLDPIAGLPHAQQISYHKFGLKQKAFDTIYYDGRLTIIRAQVTHIRDGTICPSDHEPVVVEWDW